MLLGLRLTFFSLLLCLAISSYAQVGIGTLTPSPRALLDLKSNTKGLLIPQLTDAQMATLGTAISTGGNVANEQGMLIYNTTQNKYFYFQSGTGFVLVGTGAITTGGLTSSTPALTVTGTGLLVNSGLDLSITNASSTSTGLLSATDWSSFNSKLGTGLVSGNIWVGNAGNTATAVTISGDISLDNAGVSKVLGLQGFSLAATTPNPNDVLQYVAGKWQPSPLTGTLSGGVLKKVPYFTSANTLGNSLIYYDGVANVGIGTITPAATLDITGNIKINDGTQALGYVLTSDATGQATWQPARVSTGTINTVGYYSSTTQLSSVGFLTIDIPNSRLGVGTITPLEALDINGGLRIGNTVGTNAGTLRYNGTNFQGYTGGSWVNLGSFTLPYSGTDNSAASLSILNNNTTNTNVAVLGTITGSNNLGAAGVSGVATGTGGVGVLGTTSSGNFSDAGVRGTSLGFAPAALFNNTSTGPGLMVSAGNVGIGIGGPTPAALLSVGTSSKFQVDNNGNIIKINGVTTSFPAANTIGVLTNNGAGILSWGAVAGTLSGGTAHQLPYFTSATAVANSNIYYDGTGNIGIGTTTPTANLEVNGTAKFDSGLQIPTGATNNYVLTSDAAGNATWQAAPGLALPYTQTANANTPLFSISNTNGGGAAVAIQGTATGTAAALLGTNTGGGPAVSALANSGSALVAQSSGSTSTVSIANTGASGGALSATASLAGAAVTISNTSGGPALQIDQSLVANGQLGIGTYPPLSTGAGTSTMGWYPAKAAFRVGAVNGGAQWADVNIGGYSFASGFQTTASGPTSTAMGNSTTASGLNSTAMGNNTTASGPSSTAMGNNVSTNGNTGAFAVGDNSATLLNSATNNDFSSRFAGGYRFFTDAAFTPAQAIYFNAGGNVGIGTAAPGAKLEVSGQVKITGGVPGLNKVLTSDAAGLATWQAAPGLTLPYIPAANSTPNADFQIQNTSASGTAVAVEGDATGAGGIGIKGTASLASGTGGFFSNTIAAGTALQTSMGNVLLGTTAGNVGIGLTTPTAYLHLKAGTAAAGTAPFKLSASGAVLAAPESGALEYDGTHLYFTNSTPSRTDLLATGGSLQSAYTGGNTITGPNAVTLNTTTGFVSNGNVTGAGIPGFSTAAGTSAMVWYPGKAAFRAGGVDGGTQWADASIGNYSFAAGYQNKASAANSAAFGANNTASNTNSAAFGFNNTASGSNSFAFGVNSTASGSTSFAVGNTAVASGSGGFAAGNPAIAGGAYSIAMGNYVNTNGKSGSFAFGDNSTITSMLSANTDEFSSRFDGGYRFFTDLNTTPAQAIYFKNGGNVGIGLTTPTAYLHLKAGTASANSAPLKFTSGTALTTTEPGAMEYDGTHLYFTNGASTRTDLLASGGLTLPYTPAAVNTVNGPLIVVNNTNGGGASIGIEGGANGNGTALFGNASGNAIGVQVIAAAGTAVMAQSSGLANAAANITNNGGGQAITAQANLASAAVTLKNNGPGPALQIVDASVAAGRVLTSDATGNASWQPASLTLPYNQTYDVNGASFAVFNNFANPNATAVQGTAANGFGIFGSSSGAGYGGYFTSTTGIGINGVTGSAILPAGFFTNSSTGPALKTDRGDVLLAFTVGNVGIGTVGAPAAKLDIVGNIKITDGTQGLNKVLTSDAAGLASWQPASGISLPYTNSANNAGANFKITNGTGSSIGIEGDATNTGIGVLGTVTGLTGAGVKGQSNSTLSQGGVFVNTGGGAAIAIIDGTQGSGKILTSDAAGLASWQAAVGLTLPYTSGANDYGNTAALSIYNTNSGASATAISANTGTGNGTGIYGYAASNGVGVWGATNGAAGVGGRFTALTAGGISLETQKGDVHLATINGNVGIGTATPAGKLDVMTDGSLVNGARISSPAGTVGPTLYLAGPNAYTITATGTAASSGANKFVIRDYSNAADRLTIDNTGNVGIGTTTPAAKLEVNGQVKITGGAPGLGKVLTSDLAGLASWQPAVGLSLPYSATDASVTSFQITNNNASGIAIEGEAIAANGVGIRGFANQTGAIAGLFTSGIVGSALYASSGSATTTAIITNGSGGTALQTTDGDVALASNSGNVLLVNGGGKVGIGTPTPGSQLDVAGNINVAGKVTTTATPAANMLPIAYGIVNAGGGLSVSSGNILGALQIGTGQYRITINGQSYSHTSYPTLAVLDGLKGSIEVSDDGSGHLIINTFDNLGISANTPFHFLVFKP